jgi:hypothetical protein
MIAADGFPFAGRTQIQILGRITRWRTKIMFANSPVAQADAPATSKKWTQTRRRLDSLRKSMIPPGRLVAVHEKFPVDSGHKQL